MPVVARRRPAWVQESARRTESERASDFPQARRHKPDYWLLVISALLLAIGLVVVYAISPGLAVEKAVGQGYFITRQLISVALALVVFFVVASLPLRIWHRLQVPLLVVAAVAAVAVRVFGEAVNGAHRWIQIGGFSFQPVELIKFAVLIWMAGFLAQRIREGKLGDFKQTIRPLLVAVGCIGVLVAWLQGDFGSTVVMMCMIGAMALVAGVPMKKLAAIAAVILLLGVFAIATTDYRQDRLMTFLNPEQDCLDTGYQVCQALIAVGSGGIAGLGLGRSVQAYGYLPEAENDSIFAIYAEKFGFIGVLVLLALLLALFSRLKRIAERAPDDFSRLLVVGLMVWLAVQAGINIGAMIGILPLKGITLPFISYGGTSVIFIMAALGIVFHISRYTSFGPPRESAVGGVGVGRGYTSYGTNSIRQRSHARQGDNANEKRT